MKIVHISNTPCAGAPYVISRLMGKYMDCESRLVQNRNRLSDGKAYPKDLLLSDPESSSVIRDSDVVFVHNKLADRRQTNILDGKRVVLICHSQPHHVDQELMGRADAVAVVAQYQPRLYLDLGWKISLVPNLIDIYDPVFSVKDRNKALTIGFTPSNTNEWPNEDLFKWNRKGYRETMKILKESGVGFYFDTGKPIEDILKNRARCHIVIDELVTGSYHRTSLEAAASGQVALNGMDDECIRTFKWITETDDTPFFIIRLNELLGVIDQAKRVAAWAGIEGAFAEKWMKKHWVPSDLVNRFYKPLATGDGIKVFK